MLSCCHSETKNQFISTIKFNLFIEIKTFPQKPQEVAKLEVHLKLLGTNIFL